MNLLSLEFQNLRQCTVVVIFREIAKRTLPKGEFFIGLKRNSTLHSVKELLNVTVFRSPDKKC